MQPNQSASRQADAATLSSRISQYLSAGGVIAALPGFTPKPVPARRHPDARPKAPARPRLTEDQRLASRLRVFAAQRYTLRYTCMVTGIDERQAARVADRHGITFGGTRAQKEQLPPSAAALD